MRFANLIVALVCLLFFNGCAGKKIPFEDISQPGLNVTSTAHLGERLLVQARGFYTDIVQVSSLNGKFAEISAGVYCRRPNTDEFFSFNDGTIRYINFVGGTRGYDDTLKYKADTNEVCLDDIWSGCFDTSFGSIVYEPNSVCSAPNYKQQSIEYNGKAGSILNFTYREFNGASMGSEYTQNFTMDQNEGDKLTYKGAVLRVLNATNQKIDYVVEKNFNNARAFR